MCIRDSPLVVTYRNGSPVRLEDLGQVVDGVENDKVASWFMTCLLYTSDAADERSSVDLGGRRIIKKKKKDRDTHAVNTIQEKT